MTPDNIRPPSRQKVLFLSFTYPTFGGSGSQLRAASLIRMLATDADVHLLIASYWEKVSGPRDPSMEKLCQSIAYLRMPPNAETVSYTHLDVYKRQPYDLNCMTPTTGNIKRNTRGRIRIQWKRCYCLRHKHENTPEKYSFLWGEDPIASARGFGLRLLPDEKHNELTQSSRP